MPRDDVPGIDREVGMLSYSTGFAGTGGSIRASPGDFEVEEVLREGALAGLSRSGGGYAVYVMRKRGIDTRRALGIAESAAGARLKALGLKDARASTSQYVCATARSGSLAGASAGGVALEGVGFAARPLTGGDVAGNRFRIRVSGGDGREGEFSGYGRVLNYYGYQRFGSRRPVTHLVGRAMVRGDLEGAVDLLLSYESAHDTAENTAVRRRLADRAGLAGALAGVPAGMDLERAVICRLLDGGGGASALRAVPVGMRRLYVQAYQSYLFNLTLGAAALEGEPLVPRAGDVCFGEGGRLGRHTGAPGQALAVPTAGHSYFAGTRFHRLASAAMRAEGVSPRDFFVPGMQEAGAAGGFRRALAGCSGARAAGGEVSFQLTRGSFATVVMREIMKPADPLAAGF